MGSLVLYGIAGLFISLVWAIGASMVARSKNRSGLGWGIAGFLLGPIALLIVGFMASAPEIEAVAATLEVDDPGALERATRSAMGASNDPDDELRTQRVADPSLAYERWASTGMSEHLTDFVDQLSADDDLPVGDHAREALVSRFPKASGEPEFETLAAYQESL